MTFSGLVEEAFASLVKTSPAVEREMVAETDSRRISTLGRLSRELARVQPISACGLFRLMSSFDFIKY